ncbi:MAG: GlpG protein, partial [Lentisphaeria bacterium]
MTEAVGWYVFAEFPLQENMKELDIALNHSKVPHRFTEDRGCQLLWIAGPQFSVITENVIEDFSRSKLSHAQKLPSIDTVTDSDTGTYLNGILFLIKLVPITVAIVILGFLGCVMGEFRVYGILEWTDRSFAALIHGQYWRLLTPAFLHFGIVHFIFNGLWIWEIGGRLERFMGRLAYMGLFVSTALVANVAQFISGGEAVFGGLSGVVYGYFACMFILHRANKVRELELPVGLYVFLVLWLVAGFTGLIDFFMEAKIANWAHFGGLA